MSGDRRKKVEGSDYMKTLICYVIGNSMATVQPSTDSARNKLTNANASYNKREATPPTIQRKLLHILFYPSHQILPS